MDLQFQMYLHCSAVLDSSCVTLVYLPYEVQPVELLSRCSIEPLPCRSSSRLVRYQVFYIESTPHHFRSGSASRETYLKNRSQRTCRNNSIPNPIAFLLATHPYSSFQFGIGPLRTYKNPLKVTAICQVEPTSYPTTNNSSAGHLPLSPLLFKRHAFLYRLCCSYYHGCQRGRSILHLRSSLLCRT